MRKNCSAIVVAAGASRRMRGIDKMMEPLGGVPLLLRTVRALAASERIDRIAIVTRAGLVETVRACCAAERKVCAVVTGGDSRADSVRRGLDALGACELVAVHDGARPLVTAPLIDAAICAAEEYGAAAPAVAVHDTIKIARDGMVERTPERATLFAVQTPQVFEAALLRRALCFAAERGIPLTDDCSAVEALGAPVHLTAGSEENLKITVPFDLAVAEEILKRRDAQ